MGVDISSAMIGEARNLSQSYGEAIQFVVADGSTPTEFPGAPFDLVFGGWFLNYATDKDQMIAYYKNILLNLKPGAIFVGITPPPSNDPRSHTEQECALRPLPTASGGLYTTVLTDIEDGIKYHRHKDTPVGPLDFDGYHLRQDVYETAAREAGFQGKLEWRGTWVPEAFMEDPGRFEEESNGGAADEELRTYEKLPHYAVLRIER